jgi:hypothetical protein
MDVVDNLLTAAGHLVGALETLGDLYAVLSIVVGGAVCFAGYRLHKAVLFMFGFAGGAVIGFFLAQQQLGTEVVLSMLLAAVGGMVGGGLFVLAYYLGIVLLGLAGGFVLGAAATSLLSLDSELLTIAGACLGGVAAIGLHKLVIVATTAFWGAGRLIAGVVLLTGDSFAPLAVLLDATARDAVEGKLALFLVGWVVLGFCGALIQYRVTGEPEPREKTRDRGEDEDEG